MRQVQVNRDGVAFEFLRQSSETMRASWRSGRIYEDQQGLLRLHRQAEQALSALSGEQYRLPSPYEPEQDDGKGL